MTLGKRRSADRTGRASVDGDGGRAVTGPPGGDGTARAAERAGMGRRGVRGDLLAIYLNDHLAGSTSGRELCRRAAETHRGSTAGDVLAHLAEEIREDREELLRLMRALDIPVRHYKTAAGWAGERLGRLKLNGRLARRSPLSSVVELEGLRLGVEGKTAVWETLRALADRDERLDAHLLDRLLERARRQAAALDRLRVTRAREVLTDTAE